MPPHIDIEWRGKNGKSEIEIAFGGGSGLGENLELL